ncbi:MAG: fumarate hydratase [Bacteroidota bacterium]
MAIEAGALEELAFDLIVKAATEAPPGLVRLLEDALDREQEAIARAQLSAILSNIRLAREKRESICQDTGLPSFYLDLGTECRLEGDVYAALSSAVARATESVPLRQNVIHPLTKANSGTNTGWGMPAVFTTLLPGADYLDIAFVPKGFGSEIRSSITWVLTSEDIRKATMKAVLDVVEDSMGEPCPPVIVGVGLGGTADIAMLNAKRALLRTPLGRRNDDPAVAELETNLLDAVNRTGLGPMGFGGSTYALACSVEICGAHTAVVPIAIIFQCWAHRYARARIDAAGHVKMLEQ